MSDPKSIDNTSSLTGAVTSIARTLPPGFIILAALNVVMMGAVVWFLDAQMDQRTQLITEIITRCLGK